MSEFMDLSPAAAKIKANFTERGMKAEYDAYTEAARHYERMQVKYPKGHEKRREAHADWVAKFEILYADEKEG